MTSLPGITPLGLNEKIAIFQVLKDYGVSKSHWGFILDASYNIILALILLICMCYKPREPRSRNSDLGFGNQFVGHGEENGVFKASLTVLLFFLVLLQWYITTLVDQGLDQIQTIYLKSTTVSLTQAFISIFTLTRFLAIFTSTFVSPGPLLTFSLVITLLGSVAFTVSQHIMLTMSGSAGTAIAWTSIVLLGLGLAPVFPLVLAWSEAYMFMSCEVVAMISWALSLGELLGKPDLVMLAGGDDLHDEVVYLEFGLLGASTISLMIFFLVYVLARRHGTRSSRPQTSGYELASQDDIGQELLEDDDDFEVSNPAESSTNEA